MDLNSKLQDLREQLSKWKQLVDNPGWKMMSGYIEKQVAFRVGELIRKPTEQLVDLVTREYQRGECAGLEFFSKLPEIEIDRLKAEIEFYQTKVTDDGHDS